MIKGIIFDFNGVIIVNNYLDSFDEHAKKHNSKRDALLKVLQDYFDGGNLGKFKNLEEFFEKENPQLGVTLEEANDALSHVHSGLRVDPEMVEFIKSLRQKYKTGVLSNYTSDLQDKLKNVFDIYHIFDLVVNSHDVGMAKPSPEIFTYTLDKLGIKPEEAIFIDDLKENVDGAEAVGIKGIHYKNFEEFKRELEGHIPKTA